MKKAAAAVLLLAFSVSALFSGCAGAPGLSREIEDLELILAMGVDYQDGEYRITLAGGQSDTGLSEEGGSSEGSGGGSEGGSSGGESGSGGGSAGSSEGGASGGGQSGQEPTGQGKEGEKEGELSEEKGPPGDLQKSDDIKKESEQEKAKKKDSSGREQSGGKSSGEGGMPPVFLSNSGKTIARAITEMQSFTEKHMFYGHLEHIIIGEDAAAAGIQELMDYLRRDPELRTSINLYVARDCTARELMEKGGGQGALPDMLGALSDAGQHLSLAPTITVAAFMGDLATRRAASAPALQLADPGGKGVGGLEICGSAVFREDRLAGFITADETRGANILSGAGRTDVVNIETPSGKPVALHLTESSVRYRPVFEEDALSYINIYVSLEAEIAESHDGIEALEPEVLAALEEGLSTVTLERVKGALAKAALYNADLAGIYPRVRLRSPMKLPEQQPDWWSFVQDIDWNINVEAEIIRSYNTKNPGGTR